MKFEIEIPDWLYAIMYIFGCAAIGAIIGTVFGLLVS